MYCGVLWCSVGATRPPRGHQRRRPPSNDEGLFTAKPTTPTKPLPLVERELQQPSSRHAAHLARFVCRRPLAVCGLDRQLHGRPRARPHVGRLPRKCQQVRVARSQSLEMVLRMTQRRRHVWRHVLHHKIKCSSQQRRALEALPQRAIL